MIIPHHLCVKLDPSMTTPIPPECAYNLWRMRNVIIELLAMRRYRVTTMQMLDISDLSSLGIKKTKLQKDASVLQRLASEKDASDEPFGERFYDQWTWEKWAELFEFQGDPYEIMDGQEYSECRLRMALTCKDGENQGVVVFWYPEAKLGKEKASNILRRLNDYKTVILIHNSKISSDAKSSFSNQAKALGVDDKRNLDIFHDSELYINIFKHHLVPEHRILPEHKKQQIITKYSIPIKQGEYPGMPLILTTDAPAKLLGARAGQIILIKRPSCTQILEDGTKCMTISYRYVVTPGTQ